MFLECMYVKFQNNQLNNDFFKLETKVLMKLGHQKVKFWFDLHAHIKNVSIPNRILILRVYTHEVI